MLENISYYPILGNPLIMYLGILSLISLISTAVVGGMIQKWRAEIWVHKFLAAITIVLTIAYIILSLFNYF